MLKSRVEAHKATITEDFNILREVYLEKCRAEKLDNWIREKQRTTFVRINPEWRNCNFKYPNWGSDK